MNLILPNPLLADLLAECRRQAPREAVGLLGAPRTDPDRVCGFAPAHNRSHTPESAFLVEPWQQYQIEQTFAHRGWVVAAAYHSHPSRDAQPSGMDCEFLSEKRPMLIVSLADPVYAPAYTDAVRPHEILPGSPSPIRAWIARDGQTEEVELTVVEQVAA